MPNIASFKYLTLVVHFVPINGLKFSVVPIIKLYAMPASISLFSLMPLK